MIEDVWFMGKKIGEAEMRQIAECFDEKIDDMKLCKAVLAVAAQPGYELERAAFTRALKNGYCSYDDGGRAAKALINKVRVRMGYKYSLFEQARRWLRNYICIEKRRK